MMNPDLSCCNAHYLWTQLSTYAYKNCLYQKRTDFNMMYQPDMC
jgi:hypothetical protein